MMRTVRPYDESDTVVLSLARGQMRDCPNFRQQAADIRALAAQGSAFTVRRHDRRILLIAGIARIDESYGHAWAFMSAEAGPHMLWLTRTVRGHIDAQMHRHRRIEMTVRADYPEAVRWAGLLGFAEEGRMPCAARDGGDLVRFSRINRAWKPALKAVAA